MARLGLIGVITGLGWALLVGAGEVVCVCVCVCVSVNVRGHVRDREKMREFCE